MAKNIIVVNKKRDIKIKRDASGAIIRITNEAADILEGLLSQVNSDLSVCRLASNLIEYGANNTIIRVEDND